MTGFYRKTIALLSGFFFITAGSFVFGQNSANDSSQSSSLDELFPGLMEKAVIMDLAARIIEENKEIVWDSGDSRVTIPGRPVGIKLFGANLAVAVQFTPYFRRNNHHVLVAQGQIWVNLPNKGVSYYTIMQTIPLELEEEIFFFPLGSDGSNDDASIEIRVVLRPYLNPQTEEAADKAAPETETAPVIPPVQAEETKAPQEENAVPQ